MNHNIIPYEMFSLNEDAAQSQKDASEKKETKKSKEQVRKENRYRREEFVPMKREEDVKKIFGVYGKELSPATIEYIRKSPKYIIQRYIKTYGKEYVKKILDETK